MPGTLRTLAVLLLVVLLPSRAMAAVTIGFCGAGNQPVAVAAHGDNGYGAGSHARHGGDDSPASSDTQRCSICAEHCSSAAFAPSAGQAVDAPPVAHDRIMHAERVAPAFFVDQLDRPPLA
jgi:hypothetical protein